MNLRPIARCTQSAVLLAAPFLVALLAIPDKIYRENVGEFLSNEGLLRPIVCAAAIILLAAFAVKALIRESDRLVSVFGGVAVWMVVHDAAVRLNWGPLNGMDQIFWTWEQCAIEVAIGAAVALAIRALGRKHRDIVMLLFLSPTLVTCLIISAHVLSASSTDRSSPPMIQPSNFESADLPNIYEFVFDGYSGPAFPAAAATTRAEDDFAGFTRFQKARSSFVGTDLSVPNFLTGTTPGAGSISAWAKAAQQFDVRRALQRRGYRISLYVPDLIRGWAYPRPDYAVTSAEISGVDQASLDRLTLAKITLVRITPSPLRRYVVDIYSRLGLRDYTYYRAFNVDLVQRFLFDEPKRPRTGQYVYVHVMLPHPPYVRNGSCSVIGSSTYTQQVYCSTRLAALMVRRLKETDRLGSALVIIQSDHGMNTNELPADHHWPLPTGSIASQIQRSALSLGGLTGFIQRTEPLLLVHAPNAPMKALATSDAPVLLSDLAATIASFGGLDAGEWPGSSIFAVPENRARTVPIFAVTKLLPKPMPSGAYLLFNPDTGWSVAPTGLSDRHSVRQTRARNLQRGSNAVALSGDERR